MKRSNLVGVLVGAALWLALAGCTPPAAPSTAPGATGQAEATSAPARGMGMGMGMRMGANSGMMTRHRAAVPAEYAGKTSPIPADEASLERGATVYATHCASCHGDGGMGDGPAGAGLDPAPAPIAHTSQMMGDDYLFWRISEGGVHFTTAMPMWSEILDEEAHWDVINYVRALGAGQVAPGQGMGGAAFDPQVQAAQHAEMLAQGVAQGVITQEKADTFAAVHEALDAYLTANPATAATGNPGERQATMLAALVAAGTITQAQADTFNTVHDRLHESGLME